MTNGIPALTPPELESLRELDKGPHAKEVPAAHFDKLMKGGLIVRVRGEPALTDEGKELLRQNRPLRP